jgi:hypothetical protein
MLRFLEIAWLCIAIGTFCLACWQFFTEGFSSAILMLIGTAISIGMFLIRRKQRKRFAKYLHDHDSAAQDEN